MHEICDLGFGRNRLAEVLRYALRGWQIFPLRPTTKLPAVARGFYAATGNPATLRRWFGNGHGYNIGVRCGIASRLLVLDVALETEHGPLPPTLTAVTSKGIHRYFGNADPAPSSVDRVGVGLDIRADGGYVVAPSSVHPDGPFYRWVDDTAPLAPAPKWLLTLARRKPPPKISVRAVAMRPSGVSPGAYGRAALEAQIGELAATPQGARNNRLNYAAFCLYQLVAGGELDGGEVEQRLIAAAEANGLLADDGLRQVIATIRSGMRAGLVNPRSRP